jgi:hypothetical protein
MQISAAVCLDGNNWTIYDPTNSIINPGAYCLTVDNLNNVWVGSAGGNVYKFNGTAWTMLHIPITSTFLDAVSYIGHDSQNNIWAFGHFGLAKYDGASWTLYPYNDAGIPIGNLLCFDIDWQDNIWIGSKGSLAKFSNGTWSFYNPENSGMPDYFVSAVGLDNNGNLWCRSNNDSESGVLVKYDGLTWTTFSSINTPLVSNEIWSIETDIYNNIWFGTGYGIAVYNETGIVANDDPVLPAPLNGSISLAAYPNPFQSDVNLGISLKKQCEIRVRIYDLKGRLVKRITQAAKSAGQHQLVWNGLDETGMPAASGIYVCEVTSDSGKAVTKLVLLK